MSLLKVIIALVSLCTSLQASSLLNELTGLSHETKEEQQVPTKPQSELQTLINVLKNEQARQSLIDNLETIARADQQNMAAETLDHPTFNFIISEVLHDIWNVLLDLKKHGWALVKFMKSTVVQDIVWQFLWMASAAIAAGYGAEILFLKLFQGLFVKMQTREKNSLSKIQIFTIRIMIRLLALLVFTLVTFIALMIFEPQQRVFDISLVAISVAIVIKIMQMVLTIVLSPRLPALRLIQLKDQTIATLYKFMMITSLAMGTSYVLSMILTILKASREANFFIVKLSTCVIGGLFIYYSGRLKIPVNNWIKHEKLIEGKGNHGFNRFILQIAQSWHPILSLYIIFMIIAMLTSPVANYHQRIALLIHTSVILVINYIVVLIIPKLVRLGFNKIAERHPLIKPRLRTYRRLCSAMFLFLIMVSTFIYCASLWRVEFISSFIQGTHSKFILQLLSLIFILFIGMMAWEINELICERKFSYPKDKPVSPEALKRLQTLRPLMRNTGRGFIILFITLMLFSELGLNIAPLLAGASVFGIALSLGGQTLVKDVITGSFIVIEDTMNIGDYVEISGHAGSIESMSLRTVTLRDSHGNVHSIPFNSINTIVNMSKAYSVCIFNFTLDRSVDINLVKDTIKAVAEEMRSDVKWAHNIIESAEIAGVPSFDSWSYTIRAKLKVAPGKQWSVEREINWRFAQAFEKNDIKSPLNKQWMVVENIPAEGPEKA